MISNGLEYIKNAIKDEVTDLNNPNCINCTECCSLLTMITDEEYKNYKKLFNGKYKTIYQQSVKRWKDIGRKYNAFNQTCPFITSTKRCAIYNIRPQLCKDFHCKPSLNKSNKKLLENTTHKTIYDLIK